MNGEERAGPTAQAAEAGATVSPNVAEARAGATSNAADAAPGERPSPAPGSIDGTISGTTGAATSTEHEADERLRILRLIAAGTITVEEASDLLSALEPADNEGADAPPDDAPGFGQPNAPGRGRRPSWTMDWGGSLSKATKVFTTAASKPRQGGTMNTTHDSALANRWLVVHSSRDETEVTARIPLALIGEVERFLPRQAREHLAESEIELQPLLANLQAMGLESLPNDIDLVSIEEGETEIKISIEKNH